MSKTGMDLTTGNLQKNLLRLALPIMLSNFFQTFYNLTDAFWLGKLGENARGAVSVAGIAFPLIFFLSSFGFGFVVAGTALIAQYKGAGKHDMMKEVVGQFFLILMIFCGVFITGSFIFLDKILVLLQVPPEIFAVAREYISVILVGVLFMYIFLSYQSFSHGLGDTVSPMKIQIISVTINMVLDPFFIFGIGFFPKLETVGAAYATLLARIIAAVLAVYFLKRKAPLIMPKLKNVLPDPEMLKRIMKISIPASMGMSMTSFGFLLLQGFVNSFGTVVISVFSIGNRLTGFFMMPAMGISNALATVIGQNLGAGKIDRAVQSVKKAFVLIMSIMAVGCTTLFFFGSVLTRFFINDAEVIETGVRMFQVTSIASFIFGIVFLFMGVFNGSGHTKPNMFLNITRLWGLRIPFVLLLSGLAMRYVKIAALQPFLQWMAKPLAAYPYDALWWSMVISNCVIAVWSFVIYKKGTWKQARI
ncbi:MAG: MATE family efflux transporter [Candidatus Cloacimonadota bacterium]|nr:MAG: MATE family efflux transporter [Candidatus Cloacimonadota bacterium]